MDLAFRKKELISWLTHVENENVLDKVELIRKNSGDTVFSNALSNSIDEVGMKLDKSYQDIEEGRVHLQEDVEAYFVSKKK